MKYTHLLGATVLAVALGTQGLASVTTNKVASQNFDGLNTTTSVLVTNLISDLNLGTKVGTWDADNEDASEIIAGSLSATESVGAAAGEAKHLELKTEGKELTWDVGTVSNPKSLIEMKVRLVASDTVPSIDATDSSIHAAVYLFESETNKEDIALYAYSYDENEEKEVWLKIADRSTGGGMNLTNGCMMALRVLMDYGAGKATYEGALLTDPTAAPAYVLLTNDVWMAHKGNAQTQGVLDSIAFRGTGGVDDLFVSEIEETPSTMHIAYQLWAGGACVEGDNPLVEPSDDPLVVSSYAPHDLATETEFGSSFGDYETYVNNGFTVSTIELIDTTDNANTNLTWAVEPTIAANGNIDVTTNNYTFLPDTHYLVKVTMAEAVTTYTVTFDANGHGTAPAAQSVEDGAKATEPAALTAEGWVFKGWTLDGAAYDFNTAVTNDITLVASWKQLFTVTFDANGHGTAPAAQSVEDGATATEPEALTAEGYTFNGWTLSGSAYSFSTPVTGNITLVADWTESQASTGVEFGTFVIVDDVSVTPTFTSIIVSNSTVTVTMSAKVESTGSTATSETLYATYDTTLGGGQGYTLAAQSVTGVEGTPGTVTATFTLPADNAAFFTGFTNTANPKPSANE